MIAIIGSNGMLGQDVVKYCIDNKIDHIALGYPEIDITKISSIKKVLSNNITSIINCAAYTAVDKAEEDIINAMKVNSIGARNLAIIAKEIDAELIHISTDYVFDGFEKEAYDEMDIPNPLSIYGKSKLLGENYIRETTNRYYILRTAWLFGHGGNNFIKTMIKLSDREELKVVDDQFGAPTYTKDLVKVIFTVINSGKYGLYHATSEGRTSWYEFAKLVFEIKELKVNLKPCKTTEYPTPAKRPENSELKSFMLEAEGFELMPDWKEAVKKYFEEEEA